MYFVFSKFSRIKGFSQKMKLQEWFGPMAFSSYDLEPTTAVGRMYTILLIWHTQELQNADLVSM